MPDQAYITLIGGAQPADTPAVEKKLPDKKILSRKMRAMYEARRDFEDRWKEIRDYQLPYIGEFDNTADKTNPARRRDLEIAHNVAWHAAEIFAAGIMSGLTPPSRQWFKFAFKRPELNMNVEAMKVADLRQEIVAYVLAKSNFYPAVHSCYFELPFGQAPLGIFYDPKNGVRFQSMTIGTYALASDGFGKVTTFARKYEMTLSQLVECFGKEALPANMQHLPETNGTSTKKYTVNWLVMPNNNQLPGYMDNLNMPFISAYWLDKSGPDEYLYVGGFEEEAIPVARYQVSGLQPYAQGPGWFAIGDSKALQVLKRDQLSAIELMVKPPMKGPATLMGTGGINLVPGGMTVVNDQMTSQMVTPTFNVNADLSGIQAEIQSVSDSIKRSYSADLFMMMEGIPDTKRMTAREVMERTNEKLQQLGPVVERLQAEFLNVIIQRVYNILDRAGAFPPIPDELVDLLTEEDLEVDYISPLAQAQKMGGLVNIEQMLAQVGQMAQIWPEVTMKIDPIATVGKYAEMLGAPAIMLRSDEAVQEMMQAQQEQAQQEADMQQQMAMAQGVAAPMADAAKNLTAAANDANPALTSWMGIPGGWV